MDLVKIGSEAAMCEFAVWNPKTEAWDATDGEPFDMLHPRLVGLVVDGFSDDFGTKLKLLHGHRHVTGREYPDHLGVYVPSQTMAEMDIECGDRVIIEVVPGIGPFFGAKNILRFRQKSTPMGI